jgi:hypothetical protein
MFQKWSGQQSNLLSHRWWWVCFFGGSKLPVCSHQKYFCSSASECSCLVLDVHIMFEMPHSSEFSVVILSTEFMGWRTISIASHFLTSRPPPACKNFHNLCKIHSQPIKLHVLKLKIYKFWICKIKKLLCNLLLVQSYEHLSIPNVWNSNYDQYKIYRLLDKDNIEIYMTLYSIILL